MDGQVKDDIKVKGRSADEVYDRATWRCMSEKKKIKYFNKVVKPLHGKQSKNNDYLAFEPLYSKS